jgi:glycosyltransferase involved in cell wall biosynthesis
VVPSADTPFARAQLPVKLIDAMMAGRAVIASDLAPIRWALGGTGVLVRPGSAHELVLALRRLTVDESTGVSYLGALARERALAHFTPQAVAPALAAAVRAAVGVLVQAPESAGMRESPT